MTENGERKIRKGFGESRIRNVRFALLRLVFVCDQNIEGTVICLEEVEISTQAKGRERRHG